MFTPEPTDPDQPFAAEAAREAQKEKENGEPLKTDYDRFMEKINAQHSKMRSGVSNFVHESFLSSGGNTHLANARFGIFGSILGIIMTISFAFIAFLCYAIYKKNQQQKKKKQNYGVKGGASEMANQNPYGEF